VSSPKKTYFGGAKQQHQKRVRLVYLLKWALRLVAGEATIEVFATRLGLGIGCEEVMPIFFLRSVKSAYPGLDSSIAGAVVPLIPQTLVTTRESDMSRCMHLWSLASKSGAAPSPITGSSIQSSRSPRSLCTWLISHHISSR
jgi:hypothetical protein